jgi:SNF2 family DNA or RNA helicase
VDEAHYIKNRLTKRSIAVRKLADRAAHVYLLTGSPPLERPDEMWHLLYVLDKGIGAYWKWFDAFVPSWQPPFTPRRIPTGPGVKKNRQFAYAARIGRYSLRRTDEVDLPPLRIVKVPARLEGSHLKAYQTTERDELTTAEGEPLSFPNVLSKITTLRKLATSLSIALDERNSTRPCPKLDVVIEKASQLAEPFVVFTHFRRTKALVLAGLSEAGITCTDLSGFSDWEEGVKQALVETFYRGGIGLNLQRARYAFFIEPSKGFPTERQAEGRFARIGSKHPSYTIFKVYTEGSVDERLLRHLESLGETANEIDLALAVWREMQAQNQKGACHI